jgi:drug/metabolite transporter (DMT)-like permease
MTVVQQKKWTYLVILTLIWGSSYILIKKSLIGLSPLQLGSIRILISTAILLLIGYSSLKGLTKEQWKWIVITGFMGTFFPSFFFAFAQTQIDSGVAAVLNSLTPLATLFFGIFFFQFSIQRRQIWGVLLGLVGSIWLVLEDASITPNQNGWYVGLIFTSSVCYALNVNILKRYLQDVSAMAITLGNFIFISIPAFIILCFTGFFKTEVLHSSEVWESFKYIVLLSVFGTVIGKIMFNKFIQFASPVFASSVTYTLPIVAIGWGVLDGETISFWQLVAAGLILYGVSLVNKKAPKQTSID